MYTNRWIDKQTVVHPYNEVLLNYKQEWTLNTRMMLMNLKITMLSGSFTGVCTHTLTKTYQTVHFVQFLVLQVHFDKAVLRKKYYTT